MVYFFHTIKTNEYLFLTYIPVVHSSLLVLKNLPERWNTAYEANGFIHSTIIIILLWMISILFNQKIIHIHIQMERKYSTFFTYLFSSEINGI